MGQTLPFPKAEVHSHILKCQGLLKQYVPAVLEKTLYFPQETEAEEGICREKVYTSERLLMLGVFLGSKDFQ